MKIIVILLAILLFSCENSIKKEDKKQAKTDEKHEGHNHEGHNHEGHNHAKDNTECKNCGMPTTEFPKSSVKATKENNKIVFFCSPRCYLEAGLTEKGGQELKTFEKVEIRNYLYPEMRIAFAEVFWVIESGEKGPMGYDLVAFAEKNNAEKFIQKMKKGRVITSDELNPDLVKKLLAWKN